MVIGEWLLYFLHFAEAVPKIEIDEDIAVEDSKKIFKILAVIFFKFAFEQLCVTFIRKWSVMAFTDRLQKLEALCRLEEHLHDLQLFQYKLL
jgi:hypothetical protein